MKKSFNIQELLHRKSKHHGSKPMHHPSLSRAFQRHQEHNLKHPSLVDFISTKQNKKATFLQYIYILKTNCKNLMNFFFSSFQATCFLWRKLAKMQTKKKMGWQKSNNNKIKSKIWPQFDLGEEQDATHATHGLAPSSLLSKVIVVTLAHFVR